MPVSISGTEVLGFVGIGYHRLGAHAHMIVTTVA